MKKIITSVVKVTLIQAIITLLLIVLMAFVVLKMVPGDNVIKIMVIVIYALSCLIGGILIGKVMNKQKFLWGGASGLIYCGIIIMLSLLFKGQISAGTVGIVPLIIASMGAGVAGGMIS